MIRIAGHTDERGSDEYNLALGQRRAAAVKAYLVQHGIADARIATVSYGEEHPIAQGSDESAYSQNRRAEFDITSGGNNLRSP
jgi:peptidoglycan-associated lipoprotein